VLVHVKNKHERSLPVRPQGVEKTSRLGSRDPMASGVKCGPHGGKNGKMKSWMVSWLNLKSKVEPELRGSRVMSGDWRRLHRVRGLVDPQCQDRRTEDGGAAALDRSCIEAKQVCGRGASV
jgi:hypothetical protein